jgi:uncharacterized membrane protein YqiK
MKQKSGIGAFGAGMILVALILIIGVLVAPIDIPAASKVILIAVGVGLLVVAAIVITITRLYQKTSSSTAFVRTGMGGIKTVIDGGCISLPIVHQLTVISLESMRLDVKRTGPEALITKDNLRADLYAEFYIKIQKDESSVTTAATSLGTKAMHPDEIKDLVEQRLISALRTVAAGQTLDDLHAKRQEFAEQVQANVAEDLKTNGITLESVSVSSLDQTPVDELASNSAIFDAKGRRKITEIIEEQRVQI